MLNDFLKNSAIYGVGKILAALIAFCTIPIITNNLTPEEFGIFDLVYLCLLLLNVSVALEISQAIARFIGDIQNREEKQNYVSTAYFFSLIAYAFTGIIIYIFHIPLSDLILNNTQHASYILYLIPWLFLHGTNMFISNQFRWENKPKQQVFIQIIMAVSLFISVVLFLKLSPTPYPIHNLIHAYLVSQALTACIGFIMIVHHKIINLSFSYQKLKAMLIFSSPLVLSSLAVFAQSYIDRAMVIHFLDFHDLGLYSLAFKIASLLALISGIFQLSAVPLIYKHYKDKNASRNFSDTSNIYLFCILSCIIGISFFSAELFHLFIGEDYFKALAIIPWLLFAIGFQTFQTFAPGLSIAKKTHYIAIINIVGMIINFILNIIFIQKFGLVGAAIATMASAIIIAIINIVISQRYFYIDYDYTKLTSAIIITAISIVALKFLQGDVSITFFAIKVVTTAFIILGIGFILLPTQIKEKFRIT